MAGRPSDPDSGSPWGLVTQIGVAFTDHARIVGHPELNASAFGPPVGGLKDCFRKPGAPDRDLGERRVNLAKIVRRQFDIGGAVPGYRSGATSLKPLTPSVSWATPRIATIPNYRRSP